jgi:hypothetical protein
MDLGHLRAIGLATLAGVLVCLSPAHAQPTYKLDVKAHLKPLATLTLKGTRLSRSALKDDPGFRLQYHFRKDGKTVAAVEARADTSLDIPTKAVGTYTVVLELFYPAYKGGTQQKGAFRPVSNVIQFRVEPGAGPNDPVKVVVIEPPKPALLVQCGRGSGKEQEEVATLGYGIKLLQGTALNSWPKTAARTHCWQDAKRLRLEVTVPPGTAGTLRLLFVDGDNRKRKQKATVQGKERVVIEGFGVGQVLEVPLTAAETKSGKIDVTLENLNPAATAAVSEVAFIPTPADPKPVK